MILWINTEVTEVSNGIIDRAHWNFIKGFKARALNESRTALNIQTLWNPNDGGCNYRENGSDNGARNSSINNIYYYSILCIGIGIGIDIGNY